MSAIAPIKVYFKYSLELQSASPVMSYYCKLYGVNKGFELMKSNPAAATPDVKQFLMGELNELEKLKASLGATTKDDHKYQAENFVLSVFAKVDKEERTCEKITKQNAIDFKKCGDFISMLTIFGGLEPEWQEREKYCKFKAGSILRCLKTGEEPPRGNPFAQEEEQVPTDMQVDQSMPSQHSQDQYHPEEEIKQQNHQPVGHIQQQQNFQPNSFPQYQPQQQHQPLPQYNPAPIQQQQQQQPPARTGPIKKDAAYYKSIADAKKKAQNAISELEFNNVANAIKFFKEAINHLQPYE